MKRLAPFVVALASVACNSKEDHAPPLGGGCTANCTGTGGVPTGDATVSDAATDGLSDASFEIGEAGVQLVGITHNVTTFTKDPISSAPPLANVTVSGPQEGGGTTSIAVTGTGNFTLDTIAPSIGIPTWFGIARAGVLKGYAGIRYPFATTSPGAVDVPLFDDTLPSATATAAGGTITTAGTGTVVIHVTDATGTRLAGVTASTGSAVPYYDSGSDSVESTATKTGSKGTIVFLGLAAGAATINLSFMGTARPSFTVPTAADVISWTSVSIE